MRDYLDNDGFNYWDILGLACQDDPEAEYRDQLKKDAQWAENATDDLIENLWAGYAAGVLAVEKYTLSAVKEALRKVYAQVGKQPKAAPGKFGSPQRKSIDGTKKGYRFDRVGHDHDNPAESGPHINWWDWGKGKRSSGNGRQGVEPIKKQ